MLGCRLFPPRGTHVMTVLAAGSVTLLRVGTLLKNIAVKWQMDLQCLIKMCAKKLMLIFVNFYTFYFAAIGQCITCRCAIHVLVHLWIIDKVVKNHWGIT